MPPRRPPPQWLRLRVSIYPTSFSCGPASDRLPLGGPHSAGPRFSRKETTRRVSRRHGAVSRFGREVTAPRVFGFGPVPAETSKDSCLETEVVRVLTVSPPSFAQHSCLRTAHEGCPLAGGPRSALIPLLATSSVFRRIDSPPSVRFPDAPEAPVAERGLPPELRGAQQRQRAPPGETHAGPFRAPFTA